MRVRDCVTPLGCGLLLALVACHSQPAEPAPPPASFELVSAAPGARGARAAGTDAAPPPLSERDLAEPSPGEPSEDEPSDAGGVAEGGLVVDAAPGVAL
jgi:hypothetical protein